MITEYIQAAMSKAHYEIIEDDGSFYGEIPECHGVFANEQTLETCRSELERTLEDWILLRIHKNFDIPVIDGIELKVKRQEVA